MIIWLPKPSLLDSIRETPSSLLLNARTDAKRILAILEAKELKLRGGRVANANHPAVLMWEGYESCLKFYIKLASIELVTLSLSNDLEFFDTIFAGKYPWWFGYPLLHESHSTFNSKAVIFPTENNMRKTIMNWRKISEK